MYTDFLKNLKPFADGMGVSGCRIKSSLFVSTINRTVFS